MISGDKGVGASVAPGPTTIGQDGVIQPAREGSRETYDGKIISVPKDYCATPQGSSVVIIGYKIWAFQREATNLADTVLQTSLRSHVKGSIIKHCYGDEKGTLGGVCSGTHNGECTPKTWSETVTFGGRNAVRHNDEWWMNNKNTWGVLDYKKDLNQYSTDDPEQIEAKMQAISSKGDQIALADSPPEVDTNVEAPSAPMGSPGAADPGGNPTSSFTSENKPLPAAGLLYPGNSTSYLTQLPAPLDQVEHIGTDYWQLSDGTVVNTKRLNELYTQAKAKKKSPQPKPNNVVTQTGKSNCPCIVGTYKDVKPKCSAANCGGQAHHIVADKYLRLGTRPAPGAVDPNRISGMPSLNDGPSICLNGNAGDEDTDHNIAHQNDGLIQSLGDAHNPQGTLPIGQIQSLSVAAAKVAAPADPACQSKIDEWTGINKYGGDSNALVRSTNNPPAAGSPAMNYFTSKPRE